MKMVPGMAMDPAVTVYTVSGIAGYMEVGVILKETLDKRRVP